MPDGSQIGRSTSNTLLTLPNVITFARLCAVPLSVWLVMDHRFAQAVFLFMVTLAAVKVLPDWLAILVVFRDAVIVGGVVVLSLLGHSVLIRPLYISKLNTALQIVLVAASLLLSGFALSAPAAMLGLVWLVAATTLGSGAAYVWVTVRRR